MIADEDMARWLDTRVSNKWDMRRAPKGFKTLGAGASRLSLLHRDTQTVYKMGDSTTNYLEASNYRRLKRYSTRKLSINVHVPYTRTFADGRIVVQEYADGRETHCNYQPHLYLGDMDCSCHKPYGHCFGEVHQELAQWSGLEDMWGSNVIVTPGPVYWMVDMGEYWQRR